MANAITPKECEKVLMHVRKSFFVLRKQIAIFTITVFLAILGLTLLYKYPLAAAMGIIILLLAAVYAFYYFLIWFYDVYIITNLRIISNAKEKLFSREVRELYFADISDISYSVKGIFATVLQFGTINVRLLNGDVVELKNLSNPTEIQETLKALVDATKNKNY